MWDCCFFGEHYCVFLLVANVYQWQPLNEIACQNMYFSFTDTELLMFPWPVFSPLFNGSLMAVLARSLCHWCERKLWIDATTQEEEGGCRSKAHRFLLSFLFLQEGGQRRPTRQHQKTVMSSQRGWQFDSLHICLCVRRCHWWIWGSSWSSKSWASGSSWAVDRGISQPAFSPLP